MHSIKELLEFYIGHYNATRQVGHSTAARNGTKNTPGSILLTNISTPSIDPYTFDVNSLPYSDTDNLRGRRNPLIWDNAAVVDIFQTVLNHIKVYEKAYSNLEGELKEITNNVKSLEEEITDLEQIISEVAARDDAFEITVNIKKI